MRWNNFIILFILIFALIIIRPDPIKINSDDYHVFNYISDMVENPSYFSLTGGGYRVLHRLIYLPVFWLYNFDVTKVAFPALLITSVFDLALVITAYFLFKRLFNWRVATIAIFLLMASHIIIRATWIWGGTHQIIATFFLLLSIHFLTKNNSTKNFLLASFSSFLAIAARESVSVIVFCVLVASLFFNKRYLYLKNYFIAFWPLLIFGVMILLNLYYLGGIFRGDAARLVHPSLHNFVNLIDYWDYLFTSFLILPVSMAFFLLVLNFKHYFNLLKRMSFDKTILFVWFLSGIVMLLVTTNTSISYAIPILPVLFVFVAKIIDDYLFSNDKLFFNLFQKCLFFNLFFWLFIFGASRINSVFGLSYDSITSISNFLFYAILLYAFVAPIVFTKKNVSFSRMKMFVGIFVFVAFTLTSFVQLGLTYSYFTFWHNHTDALNEATAFIAKYAPKESFVVTNPITPTAGPITGIDKVWFEAFRRIDLEVIHIDNDIPLNFTKPAFYVGTPTSSIDTDVITPFVYSHKSDFKPVARFGSEFQKYPSLRIPNSFNKALSQFLATKMLFKLEQLQGYVVLIFEKKV